MSFTYAQVPNSNKLATAPGPFLGELSGVLERLQAVRGRVGAIAYRAHAVNERTLGSVPSPVVSGPDDPGSNVPRIHVEITSLIDNIDWLERAIESLERL